MKVTSARRTKFLQGSKMVIMNRTTTRWTKLHSKSPLILSQLTTIPRKEATKAHFKVASSTFKLSGHHFTSKSKYHQGASIHCLGDQIPAVST